MAEQKHPKTASIQGANLELPTATWTVKQLKVWLDEKGIAYESNELKADLLRKAGVVDGESGN